MTTDVIMPALGMAQTSGVIVSWLKAQGDAVTEGDPLMEVETDKAVMEVAALASGYLVEIRHPAGAYVPVGEVVALIGVSPAEGAAPAPATTLPPADQVTSATAAATSTAGVVAPVLAPAKPVPAMAPAQPGRVLASPKARRLAEARGIDLRQVVAQGAREPLHVSDLDDFRPVALAGARESEIVAECNAAPLAAFRVWLADEAQDVTPAALWAALAGAAWGQAARIRVGSRQTVSDFLRPAGRGLAAWVSTGPEGDADLILRDLTGSRIARARLAADVAPVLTLANGEAGRLAVTLTFAADHITPESAFDLVERFADLVEDPLRLLL